jgi:hypothetical protein
VSISQAPTATCSVSGSRLATSACSTMSTITRILTRRCSASAPQTCRSEISLSTRLSVLTTSEARLCRRALSSAYSPRVQELDHDSLAVLATFFETSNQIRETVDDAYKRSAHAHRHRKLGDVQCRTLARWRAIVVTEDSMSRIRTLVVHSCVPTFASSDRECGIIRSSR